MTDVRGRNAELGIRNENGKDSDLKSEIRYPKSKIKGVPIIAMTAHAMAGDEEKSLKAGMNGHVTKPIEPDKLFAMLRKWVRPVNRREGSSPAADAPEPVEAVQPEATLEDLPENLPGFNLDTGLKRLMGNKRLYRKLLLDFGSKYDGVAGEIRTALEQEDFKQAHSLVHNLKGLAGNLAAEDLQAATVEVEKLVKGHPAASATSEQLNQKISDLEFAIDQALAAVEILGPAVRDEIPAPSAGTLASVSSERAADLNGRVREAVEMGDVSQVRAIAEELRSQSEDLAPLCDKLMQLADDFDLDGILDLMNEMENRWL